ncbi:hypothetical protein V6N13_129894 [Hibiscus sabdariffa]|uniref:Uncharacterized protein n=1 Tax=Hibiscus sabdariffa TaxID=183260 RepID=A0ABR2SMH9_9ROSI
MSPDIRLLTLASRIPPPLPQNLMSPIITLLLAQLKLLLKLTMKTLISLMRIFDGIPFIDFSDHVHAVARVKVLGRKIGHNVLHDRIGKPSHSLKLIDIENNYFYHYNRS